MPLIYSNESAGCFNKWFHWIFGTAMIFLNNLGIGSRVGIPLNQSKLFGGGKTDQFLCSPTKGCDNYPIDILWLRLYVCRWLKVYKRRYHTNCRTSINIYYFWHFSYVQYSIHATPIQLWFFSIWSDMTWIFNHTYSVCTSQLLIMGVLFLVRSELVSKNIL